jgi:hypothetical protein
LSQTDRFCPVCERPNMTGKLRPRFRSSLDEVSSLELVVEPPPPPPFGAPLCPRCSHPGDLTDAFCRSCGMSMTHAERYGIDGLADGVWIVPGRHGTAVYKPLRRRTTVLRVTIMVATFVAAALLVMHLAVVATFFPILPTVPGNTNQWIDWIDRAGIELAVVIVALCVVANWWTSRAYRNLIPMQIAGLRVPIWLARIAWLIPVLNLWLSKVVLDDLWRTGDESVGYRTKTWRKLSAPVASHVGWIGVVCAALLVPLSVLTMPDDLAANLPEFRPSMIMGAAGYASLLLAFCVLLSLVDQINDRQAARVERLGTGAREVPARWRRLTVAPDAEDAIDDESHDDLAELGLKHATPGAPVWGTY